MTSSKCETNCAPEYRKFMEDTSQVTEWLKNRSVNTQKCYGDNILRFCEPANVTPKQFQNVDKKKARDLAWSFIETFSNKPSVAINVMAEYSKRQCPVWERGVFARPENKHR